MNPYKVPLLLFAFHSGYIKMQNAALSSGSHLFQSIHPWSYIGTHPCDARDPPTSQNNNAISQVGLV